MGEQEEQGRGFETLLPKYLENPGENRRPLGSKAGLGTAQTTAPPTHGTSPGYRVTTVPR